MRLVEDCGGKQPRAGGPNRSGREAGCYELRTSAITSVSVYNKNCHPGQAPSSALPHFAAAAPQPSRAKIVLLPARLRPPVRRSALRAAASARGAPRPLDTSSAETVVLAEPASSSRPPSRTSPRSVPPVASTKAASSLEPLGGRRLLEPARFQS